MSSPVLFQLDGSTSELLALPAGQGPFAERTLKPTFSRHETFPPRFGWLQKAYRAVQRDPEIFAREDAHIQLGVGKNMARAIRYWGQAFGVIRVEAQGTRRGRRMVPTAIGDRLFGQSGWDPYLEGPATLWLLHWLLVRRLAYATTWGFVFSYFASRRFSVEELVEALAEFRSKYWPQSRVARSSLKRDVLCLVQMYAGPSRARSKNGVSDEEAVESPFTELGILRRSADGLLEFDFGEKYSLPAELVGAAALAYAADVGGQERTITLSRLLYEPAGPGRIFRLGEGALVSSLEECADALPGLELSTSAGLVLFVFREEPRELAARLLERYFEPRRLDVGAAL